MENQEMEFQTMDMTEDEQIAYAIQKSLEPEPKKRRIFKNPELRPVAMTGAQRMANCIQRKKEAEEQAIEQAILDDPATVTNRSELNGEEACPEMKRFHDIEWRHQYRARRGLLPLPRKL